MTRARTVSPKVRFRIFERDNFTCVYCGCRANTENLHVDHIEPYSKGGKTTLDNLVTSCSTCNIGKGAFSSTIIRSVSNLVKERNKSRGYSSLDDLKKDNVRRTYSPRIMTIEIDRDVVDTTTREDQVDEKQVVEEKPVITFNGIELDTDNKNNPRKTLMNLQKILIESEDYIGTFVFNEVSNSLEKIEFGNNTPITTKDKRLVRVDISVKYGLEYSIKDITDVLLYVSPHVNIEPKKPDYNDVYVPEFGMTHGQLVDTLKSYLNVKITKDWSEQPLSYRVEYMRSGLAGMEVCGSETRLRVTNREIVTEIFNIDENFELRGWSGSRVISKIMVDEFGFKRQAYHTPEKTVRGYVKKHKVRGYVTTPNPCNLSNKDIR